MNDATSQTDEPAEKKDSPENVEAEGRARVVKSTPPLTTVPRDESTTTTVPRDIE
jgi:hypothetical protein